ncbi:hypothetical protein N7468_002096 [Penicillium chermesinum]|uniref:Uncharacterized protein n=1 Tax=Penicillium chermesinum TaxID=63820 RepID=A0A9W9PHV7_9EURO|nr:uncharacterized protein N7468_002096 [Penicillium chermesinum]KAJ5247113.1 hypothetical protein N7468_002096 [Penicillium chermesinum]KAJ6145361.1 hypothetical protein N7470_009256 [Penicillium chermesinum]
MYTYTPTSRFLVLSVPSSAPFHPGNKFLVLSPTESTPDMRGYDEEVLTEATAVDAHSKLHRADSTSSTSSAVSDIHPSGYLFLGNTKSRRASQ